MPTEDKNYAHSYDAWIEAFTIFKKYQYTTMGECSVSAEHDELYAGPNPEKMDAEDIARLDELGWSVRTDVDCFHKFT